MDIILSLVFEGQVYDPATIGEEDYTDLLCAMHWASDKVPPPSQMHWLYDHLTPYAQECYNASWYGQN